MSLVSIKSQYFVKLQVIAVSGKNFFACVYDFNCDISNINHTHFNIYYYHEMHQALELM